MKNFLPVIILLLAGLFVAQMFFTEKHDFPDSQKEYPVQSASQAKKAGTPGQFKNTIRKGRSRETDLASKMARAHESDSPTLDEYNALHTKKSDFQESWDVTEEEAQYTNVSQAQMDIVRKRELAIQRRDYMLKMRAETISSMSNQEDIKN